MNIDSIDKVTLKDLKQEMEGDSMLTRAKYRKNVTQRKRPVVEKYAKMKLENKQADKIAESEKN